MACYSSGGNLLLALVLLAARATSNELENSDGSPAKNATGTMVFGDQNEQLDGRHRNSEHDGSEQWKSEDWKSDLWNSSEHWNSSDHWDSEHGYHGNEEDNHGWLSWPAHDGSEHWSSDHWNSSEHLWPEHGYHGNEEEEHDWKSWPKHEGNEQWNFDHWNSSEYWNSSDHWNSEHGYHGNEEDNHGWNSWPEHDGIEHWSSDHWNSSEHLWPEHSYPGNEEEEHAWKSWPEPEGNEHWDSDHWNSSEHWHSDHWNSWSEHEEDWHSWPEDEAQGSHSKGEAHRNSSPKEKYDCHRGKVKRFAGKHRLLRGGKGQGEEASHVECVEDDGLVLWKMIGMAGAGFMIASLCGVFLFCLCRKSSFKPSLARSGGAVATQNGTVIGIPIPACSEQQV